MKKVVERVQRENEALKKSSAPVNRDKISALEQENAKIKVVDRIMSYMSYTYNLLDTFMNISVVLRQLTLTIVLLFLQTDYEKLKSENEAELSSKLETKTKGLEKIVMENERLRKEIKRVTNEG